MIRGALILAVGFGLGYAKALSEDNTEENLEMLRKVRADLVDLARDLKDPPPPTPEAPDIPTEGESS